MWVFHHCCHTPLVFLYQSLKEKKISYVDPYMAYCIWWSKNGTTLKSEEFLLVKELLEYVRPKKLNIVL